MVKSVQIQNQPNSTAFFLSLSLSLYLWFLSRPLPSKIKRIFPYHYFSIFWNFLNIRCSSPWTLKNEILSQNSWTSEIIVIPLGHSSDLQKYKNQLCATNPRFCGIFLKSAVCLSCNFAWSGDFATIWGLGEKSDWGGKWVIKLFQAKLHEPNSFSFSFRLFYSVDLFNCYGAWIIPSSAESQLHLLSLLLWLSLSPVLKPIQVPYCLPLSLISKFLLDSTSSPVHTLLFSIYTESQWTDGV